MTDMETANSSLPMPISAPSLIADEPSDKISKLLVGNSSAVVRLRANLRRVATSAAPVMLLGQSGSGKDICATAIHHAGPRGDRPFVAINCAAIPADLIESELFGHERGAFTGASDRRIGLFEQAEGGTLFLDEIGDMPHHAQLRLLRVLEDKQFRRVGGAQTINFTGRVISATHRDLRASIADGRLRADLWYRLAVLPIAVPSLVERRLDLPDLVNHINAQIGGTTQFSVAALAMLALHDWPGNIRELRNVIARAAAQFPAETISADSVSALIDPMQMLSATHDETGPECDADGLNAVVRAVEWRQMQRALISCDGIVAAAARSIGINRTTFIAKMRRHGLTSEQHSPAAPHQRTALSH